MVPGTGHDILSVIWQMQNKGSSYFFRFWHLVFRRCSRGLSLLSLLAHVQLVIHWETQILFGCCVVQFGPLILYSCFLSFLPRSKTLLLYLLKFILLVSAHCYSLSRLSDTWSSDLRYLLSFMSIIADLTIIPSNLSNNLWRRTYSAWNGHFPPFHVEPLMLCSRPRAVFYL